MDQGEHRRGYKQNKQQTNKTKKKTNEQKDQRTFDERMVCLANNPQRLTGLGVLVTLVTLGGQGD